MSSDSGTETSSQCLWRIFIQFLVLVEGIDGVPGVLRDPSHGGNG